MEVRQIIEGLECLVAKQHKCEGCPFNPHPGMDWPYGCVRGQGDAVRAAKEALESAIPVEWLREKADGNDFVTGRAARLTLHAWEHDDMPSPTCGPDYCDID